MVYTISSMGIVRYDYFFPPEDSSIEIWFRFSFSSYISSSYSVSDITEEKNHQIFLGLDSCSFLSLFFFLM